MGFLDFIKDGLTKRDKTPIGPGKTLECQKCHKKIDSGMERCPNCGTHVSSMFRIKCPKCSETNDWEAKKCAKCGLDFYGTTNTGKTVYTCPMCGYKADYFMLSCPACGVKFV